MIDMKASRRQSQPQGKKSLMMSRIIRNRWLYLMLVPGAAYYILFRFGPMFGLISAFENYQPYLGFFGSEWVGLKHFQRFFSSRQFWQLLRNTMTLGLMNIFLYFPVPVIVALMLNEVRSRWYKNLLQSVIYIPHLVSWVVVASLSYTFFTTENGVINNLLKSMGLQELRLLISADLFRPLILGQVMWKETGYGTIIFLAAIASIDPTLYEAAVVDGAGRWKQLLHITFPSIRSTVVTMLILRTGYFLDTGFEQIMLMINATNRTVAETFDTYIYQMGIKSGQFSYTAAIGLFKSFIAMALVYMTNYIAKRFGEEGLF